jgi:F420-non-reducing hydrogenase iron-sulfur subunit
MLRRFQLLRRMLSDMGIAEQRVRLEWISAAEGDKVKTVINQMTEQIKALGPLDMPQKFIDWDKEVIALARELRAQEPLAAEPAGDAPTQPAPTEVTHA